MNGISQSGNIDIDLVDLVQYTVAGVKAMVLQGHRDAAESLISEALISVERGALTRFAYWKDGIEYVGTCGTTLASAIKDVYKRAGKPAPASP